MNWRALFWTMTVLWTLCLLYTFFTPAKDSDNPRVMATVFLVGAVILDELHKWRRL